jgi:hypothetical protein
VSGQTFFAVNAGTAIHTIKEVSDVLNIKTFLFLSALAFLSILPTLAPVQNFFKKGTLCVGVLSCLFSLLVLG